MTKTVNSNYGSVSNPGNTFNSRISADSDTFARNDIDSLGNALDNHTHASGLGLPVNSIPSGGLTITAGNLSMGTTPAGAGLIRIPNNNSLNWRNSANSNDHAIVANGSDQICLQMNLTSHVIVDASGFVQLRGNGANAAGAGTLRLPFNNLIDWRNNGNTQDNSITFDSGDRFTVVGVTSATSANTGANGATPAQVADYWIVSINGNVRKIPCYLT